MRTYTTAKPRMYWDDDRPLLPDLNVFERDVRPCSSFDQTDPLQFARCWSLENLQPLWAADNIRKGGV